VALSESGLPWQGYILAGVGSLEEYDHLNVRDKRPNTALELTRLRGHKLGPMRLCSFVGK